MSLIIVTAEAWGRLTKMKKFAAFVLVCAGLSTIVAGACAASGSDLNSIKTVAVVPQLGNVLHIEQTGLTVFNGLNDVVNIADWRVRDLLQAEIAANAGSRFQVITATVSTLPDCTDAEACAAHLPQSGTPDAYILAYPVTSTGLNPRDQWTGIGVFHVSGPFSRFKSVVHVMYGLALVDGKTHRVIRSVEGRLADTVFGGEHAKPVKELDASTWPEDAAHFTLSQREALRAAVLDLLHQSIPYTMGQLLAH